MKPWLVAPLGILLWACQPSHPEGWDTYGPALTQEVIALQHQYIELCHQKIQEKHYPLRGTKASSHYEKYDAPVDSTLSEGVPLVPTPALRKLRAAGLGPAGRVLATRRPAHLTAAGSNTRSPTHARSTQTECGLAFEYNRNEGP